MKINTSLLTAVNLSLGRNGQPIKFIVIHYVGAEGTAEDNCKYFMNTMRNASAHYFVSQNGEVYQCVEDKNTAWHCGDAYTGGAGGTFYGKCTNYNSIGIEMCVSKVAGKWVYTEETLEATSKLVQSLMKKHNVSVDCVIRHFDVSGKSCPANYLSDSAWKSLKTRLTVPKNTNKNTNTHVVKYMAKDRKEYYMNVYATDKLEKTGCVGYFNYILTIGTKGARNCYTSWDKTNKAASGKSKGTKSKGTKILCKVVATAKQ